MDLLTRTELESFATPRPDEAHVTLMMPTHRFGGGIEADKVHWKNLISGAEDVIAEQLRRPDVEALLAPARELLEDVMAWQYMSDGLVMFLRPDWHRTFRLPIALPTLGAVGDRLVTSPLLRLFSGDEHFLLLALSQREVRLLEGSRTGAEEVQLGEVPTGLRDVVDPHEPRSSAMARPAADAGRGGPAVFYGHGAGEKHLKKDEIVRFLREVSQGLHDVLIGQDAPMVLVGLEHLVATYRDVNSYGHLVEQDVDHNPDELSAEELHELAWPVIEQQLRAERSRFVEQFQELSGTGRTSTDLAEVAEAATQGRVETLFVQSDPWCWDDVTDEPTPIVRLGADERYADCEHVDAAAMATSSNGGRVFATSDSVAPDSQLAAIFRY